MAEVKWIKIVTDVFDDEKILLIESLPEADSLIVIWFKLLCLAGKQNNSGVFIMANGIPYTEPMLATIFRRKEATIRLALQTFEQFGMIEVINGAITIPNWGKHQSVDMIQDRRDYMRNYMTEYRCKQKKLTSKVNSKANVNLQEGDIDKKEIRKEESNIGGQSSRFIPPSVEEVKAYCEERNNGIDPDMFVDFYEAKGWMVGKNKMKSWKAAVRTWEQRNPKPEQPKPSKPRKGHFEERPNSYGIMSQVWVTDE